MNLGLKAASEAAEPGSKRARKDPDQRDMDKRMKELLKLLAKSCLNASQQVRVLKSVCLEAMKVPSQPNKFLGASKDAIQSFLAAAKEIADPEVRFKKLGAIHHHAWNASLEVAMDLSVKITDPQIVEMRKGASQFLEEASKRTPEQNLAKMIKECKYYRFQKTYKKETVRLEWSMLPGSETYDVNSFIIEVIKNVHGEAAVPLGGVAPKGQMERQLQKFLETGDIDLTKHDSDQEVEE